MGFTVFLQLFRIGEEGPLANDIRLGVDLCIDRLETEIAHGGTIAVRVNEANRQFAAPVFRGRTLLHSENATVFLDDFPGHLTGFLNE